MHNKRQYNQEEFIISYSTSLSTSNEVRFQNHYGRVIMIQNVTDLQPDNMYTSSEPLSYAFDDI